MADERFDAVVIGAGPAGSRAASVMAKRGFNVLLIEKRERIGYPVRCAEAVGPRADVERYLKLEDRIISSPVNGVVVVAPDGTRFEARMPEIGFIVDRELFDRELADLAVGNGAVLRTSHQAVSLLKEGGRITGVKIKELNSGGSYEVEAKVVVGADGVEALSGRWAGLSKPFRLDEIFSCAQELIEGIELRDSFIEFHLGKRFAPGGYAWVFPKGPRSANVGIGVNPLLASNAHAVDYLDRFLSHRCPDGVRKRPVAGGCEVARGLPALARDGFVVIGEAANQNNPFSGGGVINALEGADMAAEVVCEALEKEDTTVKELSKYTRRWRKSVGRSNNMFYHAAKVFYGLSDEEMNYIIRRLVATPGIFDEKGVKPARMLLSIALARPALMLRVIKSIISRS